MAKGIIADKLLNGVAKEFGDNSIYMARDMPPVPAVTSGSLSLDFAIGPLGGIPTNRVVEYCGSEGSGKTTLALLTARSIMQRSPDRAVVFIDMEHKLDPIWMERLIGSEHMDNLVVVAPDSMEQATEIYRRIVKSEQASMAILDSIGGAPTNQAMDDTRNVAEKAASMGGNSKAVSEFARLAANLAAKYDCLTLGINQTRADTVSRHGNMLQTPGGHAWKHACALRVEVRPGLEKYEVKRNGEVIRVGFDVRARIIKNQLGGALGRTAEWRFFTEEVPEFNADFGVDQVEECVRLSKALGVVQQAGAWYRHEVFPNGQLQGQDAVLKLIHQEPSVKDRLVSDVMSALKSDPSKIADVAPVEADD